MKEETTKLILEGEWVEIHTICLKCGGYVEGQQRCDGIINACTIG